MAKVNTAIKKMDSPVYRYWEALYMSFYSANLYGDVGKRWKGLGLLYLLLVITVFSIPLSLRLNFNFNDSFNQQIIEPLMKLPLIYVQDGVATFDKPMPYMIKDDQDHVVLIVDTSTDKDTYSKLYPYLSTLILKDKIYLRSPSPQIFLNASPQTFQGDPMIQSYGKGSNMVLNGKKIATDNTVTGMKWFTYFLIYPIVIATLYSMFLIVLIVLGFLGQVFALTFFSFSIKFKPSSRLLMVAATPAMLILIVALTCNAIFPGFGIILMTALVAYYSFAVYSLRSVSKRMAAV